MILPDSPFMGSAEIGDLFAVTRQRVQQLIAKRDFPEPYTELSMGKIWLADDVRAWGVASGRLQPGVGPVHPAPGPKAATVAVAAHVASPATPALEPPRRMLTPEDDPPDHRGRLILQDRLTIEELRDFARKTRETHAVMLPKFASETITDEALSLGIYELAVAAGCYSR